MFDTKSMKLLFEKTEEQEQAVEVGGPAGAANSRIKGNPNICIFNHF